MPELNNTPPAVEDAITQKLTGEAQKNALDLVAFLRANEMALDSNNDDGEGWAVGGVVGDSAGFMLVNGSPQFPGPWTLWFNSCEFDGPVDDELMETVWAHASPCGKCHAGWADCGGGDRTIFGRDFDRLCHSPLMFTDPDGKTLESVKKLLLMSK